MFFTSTFDIFENSTETKKKIWYKLAKTNRAKNHKKKFITNYKKAMGKIFGGKSRSISYVSARN